MLLSFEYGLHLIVLFMKHAASDMFARKQSSVSPYLAIFSAIS